MFHKENPAYNRHQIGFYSLDELVPKDHLLRQIEEPLDISFIYDLIEDSYSLDQGRPSLDPILLIKIPLIQSLFGIRSMRQTIKDSDVNLAYRWFLGLSLKEVDLDRKQYGKKSLGLAKEKEPVSKKVSRTDPESGWFHKGEHKEVFAYNVLDAGYKTLAIAKFLLDQSITPVYLYTRPKGDKTKLRTKDFVYDEYYDCYLCPNNQVLAYSTINREGYREYKSQAKICYSCPLLNHCTNAKNHQRLISRHIWKGYIEKCEEIRHQIGMKELYQKRKETVERLFGTAKEYHNLRYTRQKGKAFLFCLISGFGTQHRQKRRQAVEKSCLSSS